MLRLIIWFNMETTQKIKIYKTGHFVARLKNKLRVVNYMSQGVDLV